MYGILVKICMGTEHDASYFKTYIESLEEMRMFKGCICEVVNLQDEMFLIGDLVVLPNNTIAEIQLSDVPWDTQSRKHLVNVLSSGRTFWIDESLLVGQNKRD